MTNSSCTFTLTGFIRATLYGLFHQHLHNLNECVLFLTGHRIWFANISLRLLRPFLEGRIICGFVRFDAFFVRFGELSMYFLT